MEENEMAAKVWLANSKYEADYRVFFVDSKFQERNASIIAGGKLVNSKFQADVKVFIVDSKYEAQILITRQNFPK